MNMSITEAKRFVKNQISFHSKKRKAAEASGQAGRASHHLEIVDSFSGLLELIKNIPESQTDFPEFAVGKWRLGSLDDLPPELQEELSITDGDRLDLKIVQLIEDFHGAANVDEIIVGLFRSDGTVHTRRSIATRLYRLTKKGMIAAIEGKRGLYAIPESYERIRKIIEETDIDDTEQSNVASTEVSPPARAAQEGIF